MRKHDARRKPNDWQPRSVPNRNGLPKSSARRKKPDLPLKGRSRESRSTKYTCRHAVGNQITTDYHLSLRANLLRWATLTPDLGVEWRICPSWGIAVNGSWTSWTWSDKDHRYALWEVAPEVRYYMGEKKAWYLGAMFKAGQFNYKLSETGKQGDLMGGGITAGYQLRLNKALALDFNLGLGYLNADFENMKSSMVCACAVATRQKLVWSHQCRCDIGMEVILIRRNRI